MTEGKASVGMVGLGVMGAPMAANLARAGYRVSAFDVREDARKAAAAQGMAPVQSAADAARGAEFVFLSLPDSEYVEEAVLGPAGVAESGAEGSVVVDLSTISVNVTKGVAAALAGRGVGFLDAPVSGGEQGARDGTLSIMVGGAANDFARAEPALRVLGRTVRHVGESGMGQVFKACNQVVCALHIQAACEALALGRAAGADLELLREVLLGGAGSSWMLEHLAGQMIVRDPRPGFRIDLQLKDLRLALESAFSAGVPLPGAAQVANLYLEARAHGEGGNGNHALFRVYDRLTNQAPEP